ncbi:hypothetical protein MD484_g5026, partial [Candolleomyces efflorescens]
MIFLFVALHCFHSTVFSAPTSSDKRATPELVDGTPVSSTNYRSTSSIVITCLSTILLCTWNAAHPNVREYKPPAWVTFLAKLRLFVLALFAPELLLTFAFNQYAGARFIARKIGHGWTEVEGHFLQMGGFIFLYDKQYRFLPPEGILSSDGEGDLYGKALKKLQGLPQSHITRSDILGRSKAGGITKLLTLGQTTWFIVQVIARLIERLSLTELEVITLSYAALHGATSYLWWGKPLDVESPIIIPLDDLGPPDSPVSEDRSESTASGPLPLIMIVKFCRIIIRLLTFSIEGL